VPTPHQELGCDFLACSAYTALHCTALHLYCTALQELGCDFLACSAYKFCGPHAGLLYGRGAVMEKLVGREAFGALHCTALHCTVLHCTSLHCTRSLTSWPPAPDSFPAPPLTSLPGSPSLP
jgi:hypothetical protein